MTLINHHTTTSFFNFNILRDRKIESHINFRIQFINIDSIQIQNSSKIDLFNMFCFQQDNRFKSSSKTETRPIRKNNQINLSETLKNVIKTRTKLM